MTEPDNIARFSVVFLLKGVGNTAPQSGWQTTPEGSPELKTRFARRMGLQIGEDVLGAPRAWLQAAFSNERATGYVSPHGYAVTGVLSLRLSSLMSYCR